MTQAELHVNSLHHLIRQQWSTYDDDVLACKAAGVFHTVEGMASVGGEANTEVIPTIMHMPSAASLLAQLEHAASQPPQPEP